MLPFPVYTGTLIQEAETATCHCCSELGFVEEFMGKVFTPNCKNIELPFIFWLMGIDFGKSSHLYSHHFLLISYLRDTFLDHIKRRGSMWLL